MDSTDQRGPMKLITDYMFLLEDGHSNRTKCLYHISYGGGGWARKTSLSPQ